MFLNYYYFHKVSEQDNNTSTLSVEEQNVSKLWSHFNSLRTQMNGQEPSPLPESVKRFVSPHSCLICSYFPVKYPEDEEYTIHCS